MNRRQKSLIINFVLVVSATLIFMGIIINLRDWVNKSEAIRGMQILSDEVIKYRKKNNSTPPGSYISRLQKELGIVRLGTFCYRAQWIGYNAEPDEILAYSRMEFKSLLNKGCVVMRLDGRVEWMAIEEFEKLLSEQQDEMEKSYYEADASI